MKNLFKLLIFIGLIFFPIISCVNEETQERELHEAWRNNYTNMFKRSCLPLLKLARTWTDTMVVYIYRPGDTYHGEPSCYEMSVW